MHLIRWAVGILWVPTFVIDLLDESPPVAASEHRIVGRPLHGADKYILYGVQ